MKVLLNTKKVAQESKTVGTSIDTNDRNGSAPNQLNWNEFITIKYEYLVILVTLVVVKNAATWLKLQ